MKTLSKLVTKIDAFDRKAEFTFKTGKDEYATSIKTGFGGSVSLFYFAIMVAITIVKTKELLAGHDEAHHQVTTAFLDDTEPIDLYELNYMFAVEKPDPKKGRIAANQV